MLSICNPDEVPGSPFSLAALCHEDFDEVCRRIEAVPQISYVTAHSKRIDRYRTIYLKYSNGRCALLVKFDKATEFEIQLERVGSNSYYESELEELIRVLHIDESKLNRKLNPWIRWIPGDLELGGQKRSN